MGVWQALGAMVLRIKDVLEVMYPKTDADKTIKTQHIPADVIHELDFRNLDGEYNEDPTNIKNRHPHKILILIKEPGLADTARAIFHW